MRDSFCKSKYCNKRNVQYSWNVTCEVISQSKCSRNIYNNKATCDNKHSPAACSVFPYRIFPSLIMAASLHDSLLMSFNSFLYFHFLLLVPTGKACLLVALSFVLIYLLLSRFLKSDVRITVIKLCHNASFP